MSHVRRHCETILLELLSVNELAMGKSFPYSMTISEIARASWSTLESRAGDVMSVANVEKRWRCKDISL